MGKPVVAVSATADRETIVRSKKTRLFAAIEVSAIGEPAEAARAPLSVVFVLDASGSMQGPPIES
jgi:Mg-chelatase subunit ChlD